MPNDINTELAQAVLRQMSFLSRLENKDVRTFARAIRKAQRAINRQIASSATSVLSGTNELQALSPGQIARLRAVGGDIDTILFALENNLTGSLDNSLREFAERQGDMLIRSLNKKIPKASGFGLEFRPVAFDQVEQMVNTPLGGEVFKDRLSQNVLQSSRKIKSAMVDSLMRGDGIREATKSVTQILGKEFRRQAETLVRTEFARVANQANLAAMRQNSKHISKFIFISSLDIDVCPICASLHGEEFPVDHNFIIPVHPRSYSDDTEILTDKGWRNVKELKTGDMCLSLDVETKKRNYRPVVRTYKHDEPEMVRFYSEDVDLLVTPDHSVLCSLDNEWQFMHADCVPYEAKFIIANDSDGSGLGIVGGVKKHRVAYNKASYCVELDKWHTLLTRRNDKLVWSGNCRCTWIPKLKSWKELGLDSTDVPTSVQDLWNGKPPDMPLNFDDFLKGQDKSFRVKVLGKSRADLFDKGASVKDFVKDLDILTLDELEGVVDSL